MQTTTIHIARIPKSTFKVQLLVSEWCATCHQAEKVWKDVGERKAIDFSVVDMGQPEGRELATRLRIRSIPAIVIDGTLRHVGVQPLSEALALVGGAPDRQASPLKHMGIGLVPSSRAAILASMVYLFILGGFLPFGGLFLEGAVRPVPLHLFTLGFVTLLIFGLGEHMLPRFMNRPILLGAWTWLQQGLVHLGLLGFVLGHTVGMPWISLTGGALIWFAFLLFTVRILRVLWDRA